MPNVGSRTVKAIEAGDLTPDFKNWVNVKANDGTWKNAKKVFAHSGSGWVEVWNNRPVTTTGAGSSSAYDRITVTGTVDPNNFSSIPRFYYKKSSETSYTAGSELTAVTGDDAQSVGNITITGLVENTTYDYYLTATNVAGTSNQPTVGNVSTPVDCRQLGKENGWSETTTNTTETCTACDCGTNTRVDTTKTYVKDGCTTYSVFTTGTCTGCGTLTSQGTGSYPLPYPCSGNCDFVEFYDVWGTPYLAWNEFGLKQCIPGNCGCFSHQYQYAVRVYYCSATGAYTLQDVGCVLVTFF